MVPEPRLDAADHAAVADLVRPADERLERCYPGTDYGRQPVHTVYVPADAVSADLTRGWADSARAALDYHAASPIEMAQVLGLPAEAVVGAWPLMLAKLDREPIEDLRVDFEDGYGVRDDATEDADAVAAAEALVGAARNGLAPPYCGIRFKSMEAATRDRGLRTLDLVLGTLLQAGSLPYGWTLTLPKVTGVEQVRGMVEACSRLERAHGLDDHRLTFEVQVETPQLICGADGTAAVARLIHAADGRLTGLHFGTYDYTAAIGVAAGHQAMDHPAAEFAKQVMAAAAAGTGVRLSDGSTNVLPVGDRDQVHAAWQLHARLVRRSLRRGFYQGWDLHPAQLPTRYLATYVFFREGFADAGTRLRAYLAGSSESGVLDEPATAQALAAFVLRGMHCGAVSSQEVASKVGADTATLEMLVLRGSALSGG